MTAMRGPEDPDGDDPDIFRMAYPGVGPVRAGETLEAQVDFLKAWWLLQARRTRRVDQRRLRALADLLGERVDAFLKTQALSGACVLTLVLLTSSLLILKGGLYGLVEHLEAVVAAGTIASAVIHVLRKWRGVKPPKRPPHKGMAS